MNKKNSILSDVLEFHCKTPENLFLWKTKGIELTYENLLENVFILSSDIAKYFDIRHNNLTRNIVKLQISRQLPKRLLKIEQPFKSGNSTQLTHTIYALTRPQIS